MTTVPSKWTEVLKKIQEVFPSAVIAGGAIRDLYHNREPKDVDVFIPVTLEEFELKFGTGEMYDMLNGLNPLWHCLAASIYGQSTIPEEHNKGFREIYSIYQVTVDDMPYELIFIRKEEHNIMQDFDINICQCTYDGKRVTLSNNFLEGVLTKTIKVCNVNRKDRQAKRLQRMTDKFPEYKIEHPEYSEEIPF